MRSMIQPDLALSKYTYVTHAFCPITPCGLVRMTIFVFTNSEIHPWAPKLIKASRTEYVKTITGSKG
jgi:hypothetical protein